MDQRFFTVRAAAAPPGRPSRRAAGWDLRAAAERRIEPEDRALVPTGYGVRLGPGEVGLVCPRAGLAVHYGVTVLDAPAVIPRDKRGEITVVLHNHGAYPVDISAGEPVAQLLIVPLAAAGAVADA
ncbi:hypothetical protein [Halorhodospira neutriphila]|uniref:dUTP diphosphatase n=1 Tax=Halorhodospira neutriphila TaxID=168379 RepID=A0ABS1E7D8_9GAMM|nr:hypothetical protein [Halorhodospira neutriphila]MBK1727651.1 hypothetical protein [Halorhodospira neutriphila]